MDYEKSEAILRQNIVSLRKLLATHCFKNIMLTLAAKHQQMIAYQIHSCRLKKSTLEVTRVSTLPVDVLNKEVVASLRQKYPGINEVHLAKNRDREVD